jgi:hypothetical protein
MVCPYKPKDLTKPTAKECELFNKHSWSCLNQAETFNGKYYCAKARRLDLITESEQTSEGL